LPFERRELLDLRGLIERGRRGGCSLRVLLLSLQVGKLLVLVCLLIGSGLTSLGAPGAHMSRPTHD
jgi:hypothetical protein